MLSPVGCRVFFVVLFTVASLSHEVPEDFRGRFFSGQQPVAGVAVGGDDALVSTCMHAVMAAEATGERFVAEIIRVGAPEELHFREDITLVEGDEYVGSLFDGGAFLVE